MKRQTRALLVVLVAVALLGMAVLLLSVTPSQPTPAPARHGVKPSTVAVFGDNEQPPVQVTVEHLGGGFAVLNTENGWSVQGYEEGLFSQARLERFVSSLHGLQGQLVSTDPTALADYGLVTPALTLVLQYDGHNLKLMVGDQAPVGTGSYATIEGIDSIYLLQSAVIDDLPRTPFTFVSTTVVELEGDGGTLVPQRITLGGNLRAQIIELVLPDEGSDTGFLSYDMILPERRIVDNDDILSALLSLTNIQSDQVVGVADTEEALVSFGLSQPYSTATFYWYDRNGSEQSCRLVVSQPLQGKVNLAVEGRTFVYQLSEEKLPWLNLKYEDLVSHMTLMPFIFDVLAVTVQSEQSTCVYDITPLRDTEISVVENGQVVDSGAFKKLYQSLISIPAEQFVTSQPPAGAQPSITITYQYRDGRTDDTLSLVPYDAVQCWLIVNGEVEFLTKSRYISIIQRNMEQLRLGGAIQPLY